MCSSDLSEMCEYFQRFLGACGYFFDEGESVGIVRKEKEVEKPLLSNKGDFRVADDGTMSVNNGFDWIKVGDDFGDSSSVITGSGLYGGWGEDHFVFGGGPVMVPGAAGQDVISFG